MFPKHLRFLMVHYENKLVIGWYIERIGSMTNISVIILIGQEKIHLKRCIEKLAQLEPRQIIVIDSESKDRMRGIVADGRRC